MARLAGNYGTAPDREDGLLFDEEVGLLGHALDDNRAPPVHRPKTRFAPLYVALAMFSIVLLVAKNGRVKLDGQNKVELEVVTDGASPVFVNSADLPKLGDTYDESIGGDEQLVPLIAPVVAPAVTTAPVSIAVVTPVVTPIVATGPSDILDNPDPVFINEADLPKFGDVDDSTASPTPTQTEHNFLGDAGSSENGTLTVIGLPTAVSGPNKNEHLMYGFDNEVRGEIDQSNKLFFHSVSPTLAPTIAATASPTVPPTPAPTEFPTVQPTASPTLQPTTWNLADIQGTVNDTEGIGVGVWKADEEEVLSIFAGLANAKDRGPYSLPLNYTTKLDGDTVVVVDGNATVNLNDPSFNLSRPLNIGYDHSNDVVKLDLSNYPLLIDTENLEYGSYDIWYPFLDLVPGSQIVEPHKDTTYSLFGTGYSEEDTYTWTRSYDGATHVGSTWSYVVISTGIYSMTVEQSSGGVVKNTFTTDIYVKYVKRELRKMSPQDKENFLAAAETLYRFSTAEGRAIWGPYFTSAAQFVEEHSLASNDITCDGYHDGSGFFTHHFALTQSFEASLRSVNPHVTLPYWDFTIEGQDVTTAGETPKYFMEVTPFLSEDWFGATNEDNNIYNSRFKDIPAPKVTNESIVNPNSYGYIRSYWNHNNDSVVTRHPFDTCGVEAKNKNIPDCHDHFAVMNTTILGKFQTLSPSDGHGPMHVQVGGIYGPCVDAYHNFYAKWQDLLESPVTEADIVSLGYKAVNWEWGYESPRRMMLHKIIYGEYFHIYRMLWRSHICSRNQTRQLLQCPDCTGADGNPPIPKEQCVCTVPGLDDGTTDWLDVYGCVVNSNKKAMFSTFFPQDFLQELTVMIATTTIQEGDMLESASPADVTFWLIHPTIERQLAAKRLKDSSITFGNVPFNRWPTIDGSEETWLEASTYNFEAGTNAGYPEGNHCVGHGADDVAMASDLPWLPGFKEVADSNKDGMVTNWEYYIATDPNIGYAQDYVFDNFVWTHCEDNSMVNGTVQFGVNGVARADKPSGRRRLQERYDDLKRMEREGMPEPGTKDSYFKPVPSKGKKTGYFNEDKHYPKRRLVMR